MKTFLLLIGTFWAFDAFAVGSDLSNPSENLANSFFKAYKVNGSKISPQGQSIAFIESTGKESIITLIDTKSFKKYELFKNQFNSSTEIVNYHWIDDRAIVVELFAKGKGRLLLAINLTFDKGSLSAIKHQFLLDHAYVQNALPNIKNKLLITKWSGGASSIYKIDITKNSIEGQLRNKYKLNKKAPKAQYWLTDSLGELILAYGADKDSNQNKVWLKNKYKNKWKKIWQGNEEDIFQPVLLSKDRKTLFVISNEQENYSALYQYDLINQQYLEKIYGVANTDIDAGLVNVAKDEVIGVTYIIGGVKNYKYFNKLDNYLSKSLSDSITESYPYVIDYNLDKSKLIVQTSDSTDPGTYHLFDVANWELIKFASQAPWIKEYKLEASKVISSRSTDGQKIESFLTLPNTYKLTKPPLIVLPHGGPISVRDTLHFDPHVQFLASLGYAVLQPNYRGSSGYGKQFKKQGMNQWGRLIEDDIESAVKKTIAMDYIDESKICIYGISYGGYSALINAINRPYLYKCAASYAGVTDLPLLFNDLMLSKSPKLKNLMKEIVGDPDTELNTLIEYSPVYQSKKLTIPVFIAQGARDTRVDIEHYFRMKKLLEFYEKDFETMVLQNEGHGFEYLENIVAFYVKLDQFFRKSLKIESTHVVKLTALAERGDTAAQNKLGLMYEAGKEIPQNYSKSRAWYLKAAEEGLAIAQVNLGLSYHYGRGGEPDFKEAKRWYEEAAEQDYVRAFLFLGYLYKNGEGVEKDYAKAKFYFEKAVGKGSTVAWGSLAYMYEKGLGVVENKEKALEFYKKDKRSWAKKRYKSLISKG